MPDSLSVELNRGRLHSIEVSGTFTATNSFSVDLANHGEAVHVHLHLDDRLSSVAELGAGNHFVEGGGTRSVPVEVHGVGEPVTGRLKIVTGYGTETEFVEVTVGPTVEEKPPVDIDETLGRPQSSGDPDPPWRRLVGRLGSDPSGQTLLLVFLLAVFATLLALVVGVFVDSAPVLVGVGIVIGGVVAALLLLVR